MANPQIILLTKGDWVKVAQGVFLGMIHKLDTVPPLIMKTYRISEDPAPVLDFVGTEFLQKEAKIRSTIKIDVYLKALDKDGKVEVSL